jgi:hypothetical protein
MLQTAHTDSGSVVVHRRINAYAAVQRALGGNAPPYLRITQPTDGGTYSIGGRVPLEATVDDDMGGPDVTWFSNRSGLIGTGSFTATTTLPSGDHIITAEVTDGTWTLLDSVSITLVNDPPTVEILLPAQGEEFFVSSSVALAGQSFDPNNSPLFTLSDAQVLWRIDGGSVVATGHSTTIPGNTLSAGSHTITFEGSDGESTVSDSVGILINPDPVNLPPTNVEIYDPVSGDPWPPTLDIGLVDDNDAMGDFKSFALYGRATDPEFGNLTGTSLQWSFTSPAGTASPSTATGTVNPVKFYINPGQTSATFTIRLTAIDIDDSSLTTSTTMLLTVRTLI